MHNSLWLDDTPTQPVLQSMSLKTRQAARTCSHRRSPPAQHGPAHQPPMRCSHKSQERNGHILPDGFYLPMLLPLHVCPLVLLDYVQESMPKLAAHLVELTINLPMIFFSWFLSLFTDCLPIEVHTRTHDPCVCVGAHCCLADTFPRVGCPAP